MSTEYEYKVYGAQSGPFKAHYDRVLKRSMVPGGTVAAIIAEGERLRYAAKHDERDLDACRRYIAGRPLPKRKGGAPRVKLLDLAIANIFAPRYYVQQVPR